jgi:SPP1 family predicted phage head-tail adaptor
MMYFSDRIKLQTVTQGTDADGYPTKTSTCQEVWANVKSVTRSEFYAANASGIEASLMFEVHVEDWNNQTQVIYNSKTYDIIRSFQKGLGIVELTCKAV